VTTSKCLQDPVGIFFDDEQVGEEANKSQDNTTYGTYGENVQEYMIKALKKALKVSKLDQKYVACHLQIGLL
jgi:hypothetical protein